MVSARSAKPVRDTVVEAATASAHAERMKARAIALLGAQKVVAAARAAKDTALWKETQEAARTYVAPSGSRKAKPGRHPASRPSVRRR